MEKTVKKTSGIRNMKAKRLVFYSLLISVPVLHFLIFYVYINFNSIVMSMQKYELSEMNGYVAKFVWFENFVEAWKALTMRTYLFKNSVVFLASDVFIVTPLALLFSFYMYKQAALSKFFKVMLFMPQLLSGVILGLLYKYVSSDVYLWFADKFNVKASDLLSNLDTQLGAMIFFNVFMGFGVNVLLFAGAMSGVNVSLTESAELDGANPLQVFYYIVLPLIFSTVATVVIVYVSHLFTNQANLYTLLGNGAGISGTIGYFMYVQTVESSIAPPSGTNFVPYPVLSAMGLLLTAFILPVTMLFRHLMDKYGPSVE